jgi:hypothetical protein
MNVGSFFFLHFYLFQETNILEHLRPPGDQRHREGEQDDFFQGKSAGKWGLSHDYHMIQPTK